MKQPLPQLTKETNLFHPLLTVLLISGISGLAIYVNIRMTWWSQFNVLGHILVGTLFGLLSLGYLWHHFRRTLGIRRPLVLLSGFATAIFILGFFYTGMHLAIFGHRETQRLYLDLHLYGAITVVLFFVLHLLLHRYSKSRRDNREFHTLVSYSLKKGTLGLVGYGLLIVAATLAYSQYYDPPAIEPVTANYEFSYGEHPFRPSQSETPATQFIATAEIAGSDDCASCHADISRQWSSSVHRQAASDPTYVTNINLLEQKKGISATRYCEGCHAPIALLSGQLTPGGNHGGVSGSPAHQEGVSCLSCHRITRVVHLDGVGSYLFEPKRDYLFSYSESALLKSINHYLINVSARQHRKDMAQSILSQPALCATCHAQFMDKDMNDWGWVKMQDDYSAWLNSPYSQQHQKNFASADLVRCQDCHMPLVDASIDPSANSQGRVHSHRFIAANTMLPFINNDKTQLEETISFLQANKMRITIEPPNRKSATQNILNLDESLRKHDETPFHHYLGETIKLNVVVSNIGVGHDFPAGTIDINEAWVHLQVRDAEGRAIFQSGAIDDNDELDPQAHRYHSIPVNREGKVVWRHDLFNMIGETYRNIVKAGDSDVVSYEFSIPYWTKGPLIVDALLKYRKLNTRYARWALGGRYQSLPVVIMARDSEKIEVRHEPRVITSQKIQSTGQ